MFGLVELFATTGPIAGITDARPCLTSRRRRTVPKRPVVRDGHRNLRRNAASRIHWCSSCGVSRTRLSQHSTVRITRRAAANSPAALLVDRPFRAGQRFGKLAAAPRRDRSPRRRASSITRVGKNPLGFRGELTCGQCRSRTALTGRVSLGTHIPALRHPGQELRYPSSCWRTSRAAYLRLRARGLPSAFPRPDSSLTTLGPTPTARNSSSTASIPPMDGGTSCASRPPFSAGERQRPSTTISPFAGSSGQSASLMAIVLSPSTPTGPS